jgi:hypothetical protein
MRCIRILAMLAAAAFVLAASDASAQSAPSREPKATSKPEARRAARPAKSDRAARLNALYEALARAPNAQTAKVIEAQLEILLAQSGSDTADLLMGRAYVAMEAKENDLALGLLDAVIDLKPDFIEARARRATVYFLKKDLAHSLADLRVRAAPLWRAFRPRRDSAGHRRGQTRA